MMDPEIINFATQHDLPIFVSIDGSLDNKGITTTTVSVVARDIKDKDKINCPRSVTEFYGGIVFFPLYQARKYVLTSWYCNSFCRSFCPMGYSNTSYFLSVCEFNNNLNISLKRSRIIWVRNVDNGKLQRNSIFYNNETNSFSYVYAFFSGSPIFRQAPCAYQKYFS